MTDITMQQVESRRNRFDFGNIGIRIGTYVILFALMLFFMFPFYTMIVASFMERTALNSITPNLWPNPFIIDNYLALFTGEIGESTINSSYLRAMFNSFALALGQTLPALFITSLVGFVFAKRRFPGRKCAVYSGPRHHDAALPEYDCAFFLLMSRFAGSTPSCRCGFPGGHRPSAFSLMRQVIMATIPMN